MDKEGAIRLFDTLGLDMPTYHGQSGADPKWSKRKGACQKGKSPELVQSVLRGSARSPSFMHSQPTRPTKSIFKNTDPKISSGWLMKSVIRSSMLLGSRTNVGNVTFERSIPILGGAALPSETPCPAPLKGAIPYRSCEMRDMTIEPSFSSLWWMLYEFDIIESG